MSVSVNTSDSFGANKAKRAASRIASELQQTTPPPMDPDFPWTVIAPPISFLRGLTLSGPSTQSNGYEGS